MDGTVFRPCDESCLFKAIPPGQSRRYAQLRAVSALGLVGSVEADTSCMKVNKKGGVTLERCITSKGFTNSNTVFIHEHNVLSLVSKKGGKLCLSRKENNAALVGKCETLGYTPVGIEGIVERPIGMRRFWNYLGLDDKVIKVRGGFEEVASVDNSDSEDGIGGGGGDVKGGGGGGERGRVVVGGVVDFEVVYSSENAESIQDLIFHE